MEEQIISDANGLKSRSPYLKESNRKQVLTFDGKSYDNGLPELDYTFDKMGNEVIK